MPPSHKLGGIALGSIAFLSIAFSKNFIFLIKIVFYYGNYTLILCIMFTEIQIQKYVVKRLLGKAVSSVRRMATDCKRDMKYAGDINSII